MRRLLLGLTFASLTLLSGIPVATAHSELISSNPVDGTVLATAPSTVTLTFDESLLADALSVAISDSTGKVVSGTVAGATGELVTVSWPPGLEPGSYTVAYRVVSADGHPLTGAITFSFLTSSPATAPARATNRTPDNQGKDEQSATVVAPIAIAVLIIAICAVGAIAYVARRGRK